MTTQRIDIGGFEPDPGTALPGVTLPDPTLPKPDSPNTEAAASSQPSPAPRAVPPLRISWDDLAEELPGEAPAAVEEEAMPGLADDVTGYTTTYATVESAEDDSLGDEDVAYASGDPPRLSNRERARARNYRPPYEQPKRKSAADREEAFNALLWLVDGATGLVEELRHSDLGLSEDFWVHASAARREGLLAARALLDQLIEATEDKRGESREQAQRRARRGGINVDF